jgi:hypothetical protein
MPGSSPAESQQMYSSQSSQNPHCHIQANALPSQPEFSNNWIKVSYKRGRSAQDELETKTQTAK